MQNIGWTICIAFDHGYFPTSFFWLLYLFQVHHQDFSSIHDYPLKWLFIFQKLFQNMKKLRPGVWRKAKNWLSEEFKREGGDFDPLWATQCPSISVSYFLYPIQQQCRARQQSIYGIQGISETQLINTKHTVLRWSLKLRLILFKALKVFRYQNQNALCLMYVYKY